MTNTQSRRRWMERGTSFVAGAAISAALPRVSGGNAKRAPTGDVAATPNISLALSLGELQRRARTLRANGKNLSEEFQYLGGLNQIRGFAASGSDDVVLFGAENANAPPIHVDDLMVALRSAWPASSAHEAWEPVGCTIDPRAGAEDPWAIQDVRVFGQPCVAETAALISSRMAQRHVLLDYEMKRAGAGLVSLDGVRSSFGSDQDASLCTAVSPTNTQQTSRFWFCALYPLEAPRFEVDDSSALIHRPVSVQVLTERVKLGAGRVGDADPMAERFAGDLTRLLNSGKRPDYEALVNDFRMIELGVLMQKLKVPADRFAYLLREHEHEPVRIQRYVTGIRRSRTDEIVCDGNITSTKDGVEATSRLYRRVSEYRGGLEARVAISDENVTAPDAVVGIRNRVLQARSLRNALVWNV